MSRGLFGITTDDPGAYVRSSEVEGTMGPVSDSNSLSAVSLYSGAGGLDYGFEQAGFKIEWAIDNDPWAVQTYNRNLEPVAVCGDVLAVNPPDHLEPDVVFGGPPRLAVPMH